MKSSISGKSFLAAAVIFVMTAPLQAADRTLEERQVPLDVPRIEANVKVDAYLDEVVWEKALRVTLDWETRPAENEPAPAKTEGFIAYDGEALYVAFIAHDPEPEKIRAHLTDRDRMFQDDFVGVVLDTFNDERRGFEFFVNPLGVQGDLFQDDIQGTEDSSYDTIWNSAGRISDDGYIVEMEIPMRSLRFASSDAPQIWGIDFVRIYPRDERRQFRMYKADRNLACYLCEFQKFTGFAGVDPGKNLQIVPTVTAARTDSRPDYGLPFENGVVDAEPSLDVEWGVTPNIILNGTLNPDFSQVEADVAQLDVNNQFALFFPERRPFFLEGQDIFADVFDVIYTRNIADPDYGAKVTGKEGEHAFGAFFTDDQLTNLFFPGSQSNDFESFEFESRNAAARYRYDLGGNSTLGAIATKRSGDGYTNSVVGVDSLYRITESDRITVEVLGSETEYSQQMATDFGQPQGQFSDTAYFAGYNRNRRNHFVFANYHRIGEEFRADLGFIPQVGYDQSEVGGGYIWLGEEDDWYRQFRLSGNIDRTTELVSGIELEQESEAYLSMNAGMQSYTEIGVIDRTQYWDGVHYDQRLYSGYFELQPSALMFAGMYMRHGDAIDFANSRAGRQLHLNPRFTLRPGRHLNAEIRFTYDRLNVDGGRLFTARLTELRATWQFNTRMFVRWITQYRNLYRNPALYIDAVDEHQERWSNQVLFSYKVNPRTVFFAGYSDGRFGFNENPLQTQDRTLFLKFSYAWQL